MRLDLQDRVHGCLLGGAVGDALGAPVEFDSWPAIQARFGRHGVTGVCAPGHFTDDTQMTLFTCEGLLRARIRSRTEEICDTATVLFHAYLRWLSTQDFYREHAISELAGVVQVDDGWLVLDERLHRREAPGNTCLSALRGGVMGTPETPINNSKGCGGVMRVAPVGLFHHDDIGESYRIGCQVAAITHGHPEGWQSAGLFAAIVAASCRA